MRKLILFLVLLGSLVASACVPVPVRSVAPEYVEIPPASAAHLVPGDRVRVTLKNGKRYLLTVSAADAQKIQSVAGGSLPLDQIAKLEVLRYLETAELEWLPVLLPQVAHSYSLQDFKLQDEKRWSLCISSPDVPRLAAARGADATQLSAAADASGGGGGGGGFLAGLGIALGEIGGALASGSGAGGLGGMGGGGGGSVALDGLLLMVLIRLRKIVQGQFSVGT